MTSREVGSRMRVTISVVLGVAVLAGVVGLTAAAGAGEPISKEMMEERKQAWVGSSYLPRAPKAQ